MLQITIRKNKGSISPPEGSIESRSPSLYRTFTIEDGSEEESGYWGTDEVTGEQGSVHEKNQWLWDDNQSTWESRPFNSRLKRRKEKAREVPFSQTEFSAAQRIPDEEHDSL